MPICHTFYYPFYYLLIHSSCAQAEPTCALEGLLFGLTKVAQDAYQVRSDSAITAHFSGNCTGVIRSFFRWSFQNLMWGVGFFLGLQHVSTMFNPSYPPHLAASGTGAEGQRRAARSACCQGGARVGAKRLLKMGGRGGQPPNTVIFKTDKYRIAYCEKNPGRCRYLSLLIPSGMCLKVPAGFIALSFGRPSVFD